MKKIIYILCALVTCISSQLYTMDFLTSLYGLEVLTADQAAAMKEAARQFIAAKDAYGENFIAAKDAYGESYDHHKQRFMIIADRFGQQEIIDLFLQASTGIERLVIAAWRGNFSEVQRLINTKVDVNDLVDFGFESRTALMQAAVKGHSQIINLLLQANALVNLQNPRASPALTYAASSGHTQIVSLLLQAQADVHLQDVWGRSAFTSCAVNQNIEIFKLLLQATNNVNLQNTSGITELMYAAKSGHVEIVDLLLRAGADVNLTNMHGRTAYDFADAYGHKEIKERLRHKELDRQAETLIACAHKKILNKSDQSLPVNDDVIAEVIKYYRPALAGFLYCEIITDGNLKSVILDEALIRNHIVMLKALIASEHLIPKNILQKPMGKEAQEFLTKHMATVETLFTLREAPEAKATFGAIPNELMHYLVSLLAIDERPASNTY